MSGFSAFVLLHYWQYFVSIKINAKWNGNYLFSSASLSRVGDNSLAHKLRVMTAVKLYLKVRATYAQHVVQLHSNQFMKKKKKNNG